MFVKQKKSKKNFSKSSQNKNKNQKVHKTKKNHAHIFFFIDKFTVSNYKKNREYKKIELFYLIKR